MKTQYFLEEFTKEMLDEAVDLFISTFTKEPWYDEFESRNQVMTFFENHLKNNYFLGYVLKTNNVIVALSLGFKKPWIKGMEYYIDQFCVDFKYQKQGLGTLFVELIEKEIAAQGLLAIMLNTEKDYPSEKFYIKNGFEVLEDLIILAK